MVCFFFKGRIILKKQYLRNQQWEKPRPFEHTNRTEHTLNSAHFDAITLIFVFLVRCSLPFRVYEQGTVLCIGLLLVFVFGCGGVWLSSSYRPAP